MQRFTFILFISLAIQLSSSAMSIDSCSKLVSSIFKTINLSKEKLRIKNTPELRSHNLPQKGDSFFRFSKAVDSFNWTQRDEKILNVFKEYVDRLQFRDAVSLSELSPDYGLFFLSSFLKKKIEDDNFYLEDAFLIARSIAESDALQKGYSFRNSSARVTKDYQGDFLLHHTELTFKNLDHKDLERLEALSSDPSVKGRFRGMMMDYESSPVTFSSDDLKESYRNMTIRAKFENDIAQINSYPISKKSIIDRDLEDSFLGEIKNEDEVYWTKRDDLILKVFKDFNDSQPNVKEVIAIAQNSDMLGKRFLQTYFEQQNNSELLSPEDVTFLASVINHSVRLNGDPVNSNLLKTRSDGDQLIARFIESGYYEITHQDIEEFISVSKDTDFINYLRTLRK